MGAGLETRVFDWLDRHGPASGPFALAYSGGGDSHALLCLASDWARLRNRTLHAFIVDHALRPGSDDEARRALDAAQRLGARAEILAWQGDKPARGVQAAARAARHSLIAGAARKAGIADVLLAHSRDDQNETVWMRLEAGGGWRGCAGMEPVSPSPVWPDGRGLRLYRPLLHESRADLRAYLRGRGETWIEDPSNEDPQFERIAIRRKLARLAEAGGEVDRLGALADELRDVFAMERIAAARLAAHSVSLAGWGGARLDDAVIAASRPVVRTQLLTALSQAVSGREATPRREAVQRLAAGLEAGRSVTGAGVMLVPARGASWMIRDPGGVGGRVDLPVASTSRLGPGEEMVWDGRYEILAGEALEIGPLGPDYAGLGNRECLEDLPGAARPGLLAVRREERVIGLAGLIHPDEVQIRPLFGERFASRLFPDAPPAWFHGAIAVADATRCVPDSNLTV